MALFRHPITNAVFLLVAASATIASCGEQPTAKSPTAILKKAGVSVELIVYESGGHAFGVKKQGTGTDQWTTDALQWLKKINIL